MLHVNLSFILCNRYSVPIFREGKNLRNPIAYRMVGLLEDIVFIFAVFAATTIAALLYVIYKSPQRKTSQEIVLVESAHLPRQTDTRFSPILMEAEEKIARLETEADKILEEINDEREAGRS